MAAPMDFEWDELNEPHATRYGLTPEILAEIDDRDEAELFVDENAPPGRFMMIGPDNRDDLWTSILQDLGDDLWRPITGWPSDPPEVELYRQERLRHG